PQPQRLQQLHAVRLPACHHLVESLDPLRHLGGKVPLRGNFLILHRHPRARLSIAILRLQSFDAVQNPCDAMHNHSRPPKRAQRKKINTVILSEETHGLSVSRVVEGPAVVFAVAFAFALSVLFCHSRRESASVFAVVCFCRHPERVFRARRTPMHHGPPQLPTPFSYHALVPRSCRSQSRKSPRIGVSGERFLLAGVISRGPYLPLPFVSSRP